ncbi:MAG: hypothetical protein NTV81_03725 [Candidatus Komeilibacteria bacterium]|nr:hypothetical protein [Candidatus Komeilibacteria bacterium]
MKNILQQFRRTQETIAHQGICPEGIIGRKEGCLSISYRHCPEVTTPLAKFSAAVSEIVPALTYTQNQLQTTITPLELVSHFIFSTTNPVQAKAVEWLGQIVEEALDSVEMSDISKCNIFFGRPIANRGTVIVPGRPNQELWKISTAILKVFKQHLGYEPIGFWGTHMVLNRFTNSVAGDQLDSLIQLLANGPIVCNSHPQAIEVLSNQINDDGSWTCQTHKRFPLLK